MVKHLVFRILVDNISQTGLQTEHGFAVWVECDDKVILFDTGQDTKNSGILFENAKAMGCDLTRVDTLVLSHGHYDHTGTVCQLLEINPALKLVCHPQALTEKRYSIYPGKAPRLIAMPEKHRVAIHLLPENRLNLTTEATTLFPDVGFSGAILRNNPLENTGGSFFLDESKIQADLIEDDVSMWFTTELGLVILTGCCHSGLINTVQHIQNISCEQRIVGVIGGLHLNRASDDRLRVTRDALVNWQPRFIIPCHCTGEDAIEFLKGALKELIVDGGSGFIKQVV